jgi:hypothetical protein
MEVGVRGAQTRVLRCLEGLIFPSFLACFMVAFWALVVTVLQPARAGVSASNREGERLVPILWGQGALSRTYRHSEHH